MLVMVTAVAITMSVNLYKHQKEALAKIQNGSILWGGVGSGKSLTSLAYYFKVCDGSIDNGDYITMKNQRDLYIITTARKRDTLEWEGECSNFLLSTNPDISINGVKVIIDSWNNIKKYSNVNGAFFIFDEQRVVGSGTWVKAFIKIAKRNKWILLSATPGDTWMDYVPVFVANGFYKNKTEFITRHVVYSRFSKFPKVDHYIETGRLEKLRKEILVEMPYQKPTTPHDIQMTVSFDKKKFDYVMLKRWNVFEDKPIKDISELCYILRRVVNSDTDRIDTVKKLLDRHPKVIIFYNFNYELDMLRDMCSEINIPVGEWNGHKHEPIPKTKKWAYLVQYTAGAEGWNCIETNAIIFYSQNYSYKITTQAAGRIDRLNTTFKDLYYYHLRSDSKIDNAILKSLTNKKVFNARYFKTN